MTPAETYMSHRDPSKRMTYLEEVQEVAAGNDIQVGGNLIQQDNLTWMLAEPCKAFMKRTLNGPSSCRKICTRRRMPSDN